VCNPLDSTGVTEQTWTPAGDASHVYDYTDENGTLLFQALRVTLPGGGKRFFQRRPDATAAKGWAWNLQGVRRVLYRLPELIRSIEGGHTIYIPEGEKDVEALRRDGYRATCNPMGAGKWLPEFVPLFEGATVVIISDADDPGRKHAREVRDSLLEVAAHVTIVESTLANAKDYSDHRAKGGTVETMAVTFTTVEQAKDVGGIGLRQMVEAEWDMGTEIIPGHLAQANVVLLTGFEGHGKSTMMRQMAVQCAAGINPFTLAPMPPLRVMYVDAENPEHQQVLDWRKLDRLATRHIGRPIDNEQLVILSEWMAEPDLTTTDGQAWLFERIQAYTPDICFMGPVQNLVSRDVKDDEVVRKLKKAVNAARAIRGTAFIIEHHAPHRMAGDPERSTRPYGSSLFQKWPDFGYGLKPTRDAQEVYEVHPNRKPRVRSRAWPAMARWGARDSLEWPWMFEDDVRGSVKEPPGQDWSGRRGTA
jgi:hypothetical protein